MSRSAAAAATIGRKLTHVMRYLCT